MTTAYDLCNVNGPMTLPAPSPKGTLTLLRFTAPCRKHPNGTVVAKGHPPFCPHVIGLAILPRVS